MSTNEYLDSLTIDQLRYARDEADKRIKKAEQQPKKIVWVVSNGFYNDGWYREEDYDKALKHLQKLLMEDRASKSFRDMIKEHHSVNLFHLPSIEPYYNNETEYEEWFK